jgi:hypothetical protein
MPMRDYARLRPNIFQFPWKDLNGEKPTADEGKVYGFANGVQVTIVGHRPNETIEALTKKPATLQTLQSWFHDSLPGNDYEFTTAVLAATPPQFEWTPPQDRVIAPAQLSDFKGFTVSPAAAEGIYSVANREFQGFQHGLRAASRASCSIYTASGVILKSVLRIRVSPICLPNRTLIS